MFSSTMMASSTTMPTANESPSSVNVFSVKPRKYIAANVPTIDVGIASSTLIVELIEPRKTQQTRAVSTTDSSIVKKISWIASFTDAVPSKTTSSRRSSGSDFLISATRSLTASATATALAPRCFFTPSPCDGNPLVRASIRRSSRPSSTSATSRSFTRAPPSISATTMSRKSSRSSASPCVRTLTSRASDSRRPAGSSRCSRERARSTSAAVRP
jgi:hypothetical protein